jgi:hypothetical protein
MAYRPFEPESPAHRKLGPFDWPGACAMLRASVQRACGCEAYVLTDADTPIDGPAYRFPVRESRLMLWLLDVWLQYLESTHFDEDTAMISPDSLVFGDLRPYFKADLGLIVRVLPKYQDRPLLNGVQFWAVAGKDRLIALYREALARAQAYPDVLVRWGADTEALRASLPTLRVGSFEHGDLSIHGFRRWDVVGEISTTEAGRIAQGKRPQRLTTPILDFKYMRKLFQRAYFDATIGATVSA